MAVLNKDDVEDQTPNPDLRVVEATVDDPAKLKTCHQCRQKKTDLFGSCVTQKKHTTCPLKFCSKCLVNRYGEKPEEVSLKTDWVCPKCRGECNCSCCRKKRGQMPTGILVRTAKKNGCSSVSEFLKTDGSEKYFYRRKGAVVVPSPPELEAVVVASPPELEAVVVASPPELEAVVVASLPKQEAVVVASPSKHDQENAIKQKPVCIEISKKTKREDLKDINNGCINEIAAMEKTIPKKIKITDSVHETGVTKEASAEERNKKTTAEDFKGNNISGTIAETKPTLEMKEEDQVEAELPQAQGNISMKDTAAKGIKGKNIVVNDAETSAEDIKRNNIVGKLTRTKPLLKRKEKVEVEVKLPQGNSLITVSGIDLPPEDVGNVFQFLEFCSAFGEALDLRKGQAECVIREMFYGRSTTRQPYSTLTQMVIQLLAVISEGRGEKSVSLSATDASWFIALGECIGRSHVKLDDFPPEVFEKGISQYENLDSSQRLKILNFLCDETLGTSLMRDCIDKKNLEFVKRKKEAKEKINAAKEKEKQLKQKLQDELAKAVTEKNGIPLTITEHDAIVSPINAEIKEVQSEMQNAKLSKESQGSNNALRSSPVEVDDNGLVFWRFKSFNDGQNILLQDLGNPSEACPQEKWFSFSSEQTPEVEKYISNIRMKRRRAKKNAKTIITTSE